MANEIKLNFMSYCSYFEANGDIHVPLGSHACFANAINRKTIRKESYIIYLFKDLKVAKKHQSNFCPLTKEELIYHIKQARRIFKFNYNVEEEPEVRSGVGVCPAFKVTFDVDANHFYHRYLLTWLRYAYEFPYNMILLEAFRLKKYAIPKETLPNLFVLITNSLKDSYYSDGHSIGCSYGKHDMLKEVTLKKNISELAKQNSNYGCLNQIYPRTKNKDITKLTRIDLSYLDVDQWLPLETFDKRVEKYVKNYKILKGTKF